MEKIKFEFEEVKNKVIKIGKNKVEVKPYLSTEDISVIMQLCNEEVETDINNYDKIKCIFDILVIEKCTNIQVQGVETKTNNGKIRTTINIDNNTIAEFENTGLLEKISPYIFNYNTALNQLFWALGIKSIYNAFKIFNLSIPTGDQIEKTLNSTLIEMKKFRDEDPKTFEKILNQHSNKEIKKEAVKEYLKEKEDKKAKRITKK